MGQYNEAVQCGEKKVDSVKREQADMVTGL